MTGTPPLLIVDGHHLLYRAYYGFPARIHNRAKTRDLTGVFGFLALLRKAHLAHAGDHEIVVVFDGENGAASRTDADGAYKANRADADHSPIASLADVKHGLDGLSLDDLPASGRLTGATGVRVLERWDDVRRWRDLIRLDAKITIPHDPVRRKATPPLPPAAVILESLKLW